MGLLRLGLMAGTGVGLDLVRNAGERLVRRIIVMAVVGFLGAVALCFAAVAAWYALLPPLGPVWASLAVAVALLVLAGLVWLVNRIWTRERRAVRRAASAIDPLTASAAALPALDLPGLLERHAVTVMLGAFVAGMLMNRRR